VRNYPPKHFWEQGHTSALYVKRTNVPKEKSETFRIAISQQPRVLWPHLEFKFILRIMVVMAVMREITLSHSLLHFFFVL